MPIAGGAWGPLLPIVASFALLAGCGTPARSLPTGGGAMELHCCTRGEEAVTIQYLGVGGWLFRMGEASLLTAPFFSNPGLLEVGVGRISTDTAMVDRFLPPVEDVEAILVGHGHYDHLMDVPYIAHRRAPNARVYGSRTVVNLLRGSQDLEPARLISVEERVGDHETPGEWVYVADGRIRFMALRSGHAPHFMGIHLYRGQQETPASQLPTWAGEWLEGTPLAYLIDFLSPTGEVVYRVHYQDAASAAPEGFPPELGDGVEVDLAILCPPGYEELDDYPEGILERLRPGRVFLGHWENFFRPRTEELRSVPGTDLEKFIDRVEAVIPSGTEWSMLEPGLIVQVSGQ